MSTNTGLISVTILTGFLGAGKTTLLKRVLSEAHGHKIAVIENEFGAENIDNEILMSGGREQIIQMSNGCICCTIREDLRASLCDLAKKRSDGELQFDRVVIETTGLADPGPVAQTFFMDDAIVSHYLLNSILTLVDAKHADQSLNDRQEARRQIGFADRIFISKSDLVGQDDLDALKHRLRHMNPRAPQQVVHFGEVAIADVLDLRGFNLNVKLDIDPDFLAEERPDRRHEHRHGAEHSGHDHGHHHHHDDDVKSFLFCSERAFDPLRFGNFLQVMVNAYGPRLLRYKGVLNMEGTDRKVIFQGVHQLMSSDLGPAWGDAERRGSKMIFIGIDLPKELLLRSLEQCLA